MESLFILLLKINDLAIQLKNIKYFSPPLIKNSSKKGLITQAFNHFFCKIETLFLINITSIKSYFLFFLSILLLFNLETKSPSRFILSIIFIILISILIFSIFSPFYIPIK